MIRVKVCIHAWIQGRQHTLYRGAISSIHYKSKHYHAYITMATLVITVLRVCTFNSHSTDTVKPSIHNL